MARNLLFGTKTDHDLQMEETIRSNLMTSMKGILKGKGWGLGGDARIGDVKDTYTRASRWRVVEYGG